jgi:hypothetical protein
MHWYNKVLGNPMAYTMEHSIYPWITQQRMTVRVITRAGVMSISVHYSIDTHLHYSATHESRTQPVCPIRAMEDHIANWGRTIQGKGKSRIRSDSQPKDQVFS